MNDLMVLTVFILAIVSFFWGIYKTTITQKKIYLFYTVPFVAIIGWMFFI